MNEIALVLSLLSIILCSITVVFSILAYSRVVGMEKSTHQVQWMPIETPSDHLKDEYDGLDEEEIVQRERKKLYEQYNKMYPDVEEEQV